MTKSEKLKSEMLALCPDFANWDAGEWELWTNDFGVFSVHEIFSLFSHYVSERLEAGNVAGIDPVFRFVEDKLGDDEELANAAMTCFLENIMNRVPDWIHPATFVAVLGPKSREFCQGWDTWCGTKTEGL